MYGADDTKKKKECCFNGLETNETAIFLPKIQKEEWKVMKKHNEKGRQLLVKGYWSMIGAICGFMLSIQPVYAANTTIWDRFTDIMRDIYGQVAGISTIVAVTAAAVALLVRMIFRNQQAVDEVTS